MGFFGKKDTSKLNFASLEKPDVQSVYTYNGDGNDNFTYSTDVKLILANDEDIEYEICEVPGYITRRMLLDSDGREHSTISSRHAEITKKDGKYCIKDVSSNGTMVNGVKLEKNTDVVAIKEGDVLTFASHEFVVKKIYG